MKRLSNTQGVEFKFMTIGYYYKVTHLNTGKSFKLTGISDLSEVTEYLDSKKEIENYSLVVNNTNKIAGYLFAINYKGNEFLNLNEI